MNKIIKIVSSLLLSLGLLAACAPSKTATTQATAGTAKKLSVVATIFPAYDWAREVFKGNDNVEITMLLDDGVDLHSYQPTIDDIMKVSEADMFIYVGGLSEHWVEDVLKDAKNPNMVVINLMEELKDRVKEEEIVEGMQVLHDHEHGHEEIEMDEIEDRTLADFDGEWQSLYPLAENGSLDEVFEHLAEHEEGTSQEDLKKTYVEHWMSDYDRIEIVDGMIAFTDHKGNVQKNKYTYQGFAPIKAEDGDIEGVRYQFMSEGEGTPKYVQFNDHNHEAVTTEHFHLYYGNESFDELTAKEAGGFYMSALLSPEEISEELLHDDHEHESEQDEHVWLSLRNAERLTNIIAQKAEEMDKDNATKYQENAKAYVEQLKMLDQKYEDVVDSAKRATLVFGDRFPFRYLVDDYNLNYYAAFNGCSAETEASFETIKFLSNKVDELNLPTILTIEGTKHKIAETIGENTTTKDKKVLVMDSMQSKTNDDLKNGVTYLKVMTENLEVLKQALN